MVAKISRKAGGWLIPVDRTSGRSISNTLIGDAIRNGHLSDLEAWADFMENQEDVKLADESENGK